MSLSRKAFQVRLMKTLLNTPKPSRSIFDVNTLGDFDRKVKCSNKPVLVNFHAGWCTPCKALTPRLTNIITEQQGRMHMARVDVDECADLALSYNVGTVPAMLVMYKGQVLNRMEGLQPSERIRSWLKSVIRKSAPQCELK